jgi:hypothetical protein
MAQAGITGEPWAPAEQEAAVADYFRMLRMQELGQTPNKSEHKRRLHELLPARSLDSIEYKHRNISAVLHLLGAQSLSGYKSLPNFQRSLIEIVGRALESDHALDQASMAAVERTVEPPLMSSFDDFVVEAPKAPDSRIGERNIDWARQTPVRRDYLERESRNRSLGAAGEALVLQFEAHRLHAEGASSLADRVEHLSRTKGDGAGFDILSFDADGRERFIEVKTTSYDPETPFFISPLEVAFSGDFASQFHLYRVYAFRRKPQMFDIPGAVAANFRLDPSTFRAMLLGT